MSFWIFVIALSALTLFLLSMPLWRRANVDIDRADFDLTIFKDQLEELDRDEKRGLISENEAQTARLEIQRRMLAADAKRSDVKKSSQGPGKTAIALSAAMGLGVLAGTVLLYNHYGTLGYGDMPFASRDFQAERIAANAGNDMSDEINALEQRLESDPTDIPSWIMLGRTLRVVGRFEESIEAFRNAVKHSNRHPAALTDLAEAKIYATEGFVDDETRDALSEALQKDPLMLKAWFFFGYTQHRGENYAGAVQTWVDLQHMSPPNAPWLEQVKAQIDQAVLAGALDLSDFEPSERAIALGKRIEQQIAQEEQRASENTQHGPTAEQMKAAAQMTPEEREQMIRDMVAGLAERMQETPNNLAGWQRLYQAYSVLGEEEKAAEAQAEIERIQAGM